MDPQLFTVATLTGHVGRAYGPGYSAVMDNGPARRAGVAHRLSEHGQEWGDPFEVSTVRVSWPCQGGTGRHWLRLAVLAMASGGR